MASKFVFSALGTNTGGTCRRSSSVKSMGYKKGCVLKLSKPLAPMRSGRFFDNSAFIALEHAVLTGGFVVGYLGDAALIRLARSS